jgi:hypothetical protein
MKKRKRAEQAAAYGVRHGGDLASAQKNSIKNNGESDSATPFRTRMYQASARAASWLLPRSTRGRRRPLVNASAALATPLDTRCRITRGQSDWTAASARMRAAALRAAAAYRKAKTASDNINNAFARCANNARCPLCLAPHLGWTPGRCFADRWRSASWRGNGKDDRTRVKKKQQNDNVTDEHLRAVAWQKRATYRLVTAKQISM